MLFAVSLLLLSSVSPLKADSGVNLVPELPKGRDPEVSRTPKFDCFKFSKQTNKQRGQKRPPLVHLVTYC